MSSFTTFAQRATSAHPYSGSFLILRRLLSILSRGLKHQSSKGTVFQSNVLVSTEKPLGHVGKAMSGPGTWVRKHSDARNTCGIFEMLPPCKPVSSLTSPVFSHLVTGRLHQRCVLSFGIQFLPGPVYFSSSAEVRALGPSSSPTGLTSTTCRLRQWTGNASIWDRLQNVGGIRIKGDVWSPLCHVHLQVMNILHTQ